MRSALDDLILRRPRQTDLARLEQLYREAFGKRQRHRSAGVDRLRHDTVVAELDERPVGFGCWHVVRSPSHEREISDLLACLQPPLRQILEGGAHDDPLALAIEAPPGWNGAIARGDWVLTAVAVRRDLRRCGIGTELARVRVELAQAAGARRVFVHAVYGSGSRALYERLGFTPLISKRHHYADGTGMTLLSADLQAL